MSSILIKINLHFNECHERSKSMIPYIHFINSFHLKSNEKQTFDHHS